VPINDAREDQEHEEAEAARQVPVLKKLLVFALLTAAFLALGTYPPLHAQLQPETLDKPIEGLGWLGAFLLFLLGALTPLLMLPRWPIAVVSGMVYGVFWGACLANTASLVGAGLQYWMAHSTLSHLARRWLAKSRWRHLLENPKNAFSVLFLVRAFPLSNFVATNLLCGTLRIPLRTYLLASALGMIPSTVLYAAWGKLVMKPSGGFLFLVFVTLAFIVLGTVYARRFLARADQRIEAD
jgi:uncharacterized membrane protein YdjX (TVP38/TMEM64 family)